jgi:hypothetical protein
VTGQRRTLHSRRGTLSTKVFVSEDSREWAVTKVGSLLTVGGDLRDGEKLYEVARSCAFRLGVVSTRAGVPLEHVNEHRRIWSTIWDRGTPKPVAVAGVART